MRKFWSVARKNVNFKVTEQLFIILEKSLSLVIPELLHLWIEKAFILMKNAKGALNFQVYSLEFCFENKVTQTYSSL